MGNILDLLLQADETKLKKPTKQIEIKRLSEAFGEKAIFTCQAISPDKFQEIQENALKISGKDVDLDVNEMQIMTVIEGVLEPSFKSKELRDKFKAPTPKELIKKVLLIGEITALYNVVSELSGFDGKAIEEVKNLQTPTE